MYVLVAVIEEVNANLAKPSIKSNTGFANLHFRTKSVPIFSSTGTRTGPLSPFQFDQICHLFKYRNSHDGDKTVSQSSYLYPMGHHTWKGGLCVKRSVCYRVFSSIALWPSLVTCWPTLHETCDVCKSFGALILTLWDRTYSTSMTRLRVSSLTLSPWKKTNPPAAKKPIGCRPVTNIV